MWKEKKSLSTLQYDSKYNGKDLVRLCSTISVEPIIQENVASSVDVEKKAIFVVYRKKKEKNADCADITKIKDEKI